ncbi:NADPH:quinone reductase [Luteitalea sp. TBR-22]|nr:NADPH:quinone reductase [Luteitalea sp. TBR-22]
MTKGRVDRGAWRSRVGRVLRWGVSAALVVLGVAFTVAYVRSGNVCDQGPLPTGPTPMAALVQCEYGGPDVLRMARIARPSPGPGEVLVRVRAASVNPVDWHQMRGVPRVMRLSTGLRKPSDIRVGVDFAGIVAAVGPGVHSLAVGDAVFGMRNGALAEYVVVPTTRVVRKPDGVSFEAAAAAPLAAITALQGLRDHGQVRRGQQVLVNGASGGVGTFAVQIARQLGATVTGVCSTRNVAMVKGLGAQRVIDYTRADVTRLPDRYDVIFDTVGNHALGAIRGVLAEGGRYVGIGGGTPHDAVWLGPLPRVLAMMLRSRVGSSTMTFFVTKANAADLDLVARWLSDGTLRTQIDRTLPFAQAAEAIRYLEQGRARGKVVVMMSAP